jgi:alpha-glucosidase
MPWLYPDMMDTVKPIFNLRERLVPYLARQMDRCVDNDEPLITPVFLRDEKYDKNADWFMCGDKILACPVFDEGVIEITIQLPHSNTGFRLRGEGELLRGETAVMVSCGINELPVWFTEE